MNGPEPHSGPLTAFERATRGLQFSKDFHAALEAVMRDELAPASQRVLAWIKRRSWGSYSLHCVRENGRPAIQADCVQELGISKGTVSKTITYLELRGYVRLDGKIILPLIDPQLGPTPEKVSPVGNFSNFLDLWKVSNASNFKAMQDAEATLKQLRKVLISDYKKWKTSATSSEAPLYKNSDLEEVQASSSSSGISLVPPLPKEPTTTTPAAEPAEPEQPAADPLPPAVVAALSETIRTGYTRRAAKALVATARQTAADLCEPLSDEDLTACIYTAWEAARRKVHTIKYFDTALPEKIEALLEARQRARENSAERTAEPRPPGYLQAFDRTIGDGSLDSFRRVTNKPAAEFEDLTDAIECFDRKFGIGQPQPAKAGA